MSNPPFVKGGCVVTSTGMGMNHSSVSRTQTRVGAVFCVKLSFEIQTEVHSQSAGGSQSSTWSLSHNYISTKQIDQEAERVRVGPRKLQKVGRFGGRNRIQRERGVWREERKDRTR